MLSPLHALGVSVPGAETPYATVVLRGQAPGAERGAGGPLYVEESLPGINVSPARYYGAMYACSHNGAAPAVPAADIDRAASARLAGAATRGPGPKVVRRMAPEAAARAPREEEERRARAEAAARRNGQAHRTHPVERDRAPAEDVEGGSAFAAPLVPPPGVLRVSWRREGWFGDARPRELRQLESLGVPLPGEEGPSRLLPAVDFLAPEAGGPGGGSCSIAPRAFLPSAGDLEFLECLLLALAAVATGPDVVRRSGAAGPPRPPDGAGEDSRASSRSAALLRWKDAAGRAIGRRLSTGIFSGPSIGAPARPQFASQVSDGPGPGAGSEAAPSPQGRPRLESLVDQLMAKAGRGAPGEAVEVAGLDHRSLLGTREDVRPFVATVSVTKWDGRQATVRLCYPPTLLGPEEQPRGLYRLPRDVQFDAESGVVVKTLPVGSAGRLPNGFHVGVAGCCHCGVHVLAAHAERCQGCRSAMYCSDKCLAQHAMSAHPPSACHGMHKAAADSVAQALSREGMPKWGFYAGEVPSLHYWLERLGLDAPSTAWQAIDPCGVPAGTARHHALTAQSAAEEGRGGGYPGGADGPGRPVAPGATHVGGGVAAGGDAAAAVAGGDGAAGPPGELRADLTEDALYPWGEELPIRGGLLPEEWSKRALAARGEVADVQDWGQWLDRRGVPPESPLPVAMTHALTLFSMVKRCADAQLVPLAGPGSRLIVHVVGSRWQLFVEPRLWSELGVLLPGILLELHVFAPLAPPSALGGHALGPSVTAHVHGSLYSQACPNGRGRDVPAADLVVGLNLFDPLTPALLTRAGAGEGRAGTAWLSELRHARGSGAPVLFTVPAWPPAPSGAQGATPAERVPGHESAQLNPFRSPLTESLEHCGAPYASNGWVLAYRMRPSRRAARSQALTASRPGSELDGGSAESPAGIPRTHSAPARQFPRRLSTLAATGASRLAPVGTPPPGIRQPREARAGAMRSPDVLGDLPPAERGRLTPVATVPGYPRGNGTPRGPGTPSGPGE